ncbi:Nonribosomal peptide synthetases (NRPS) [Aspergillus tanneri]|uniref:Nonribosomal peptide synthetases (NRPS) n=1 Tax=Aspergillus tanneri TaxID=1220188 RepID=A0A5M9N4M2_9EURO|nr:Nonribosomal peptide synthetases (NRPS) [Aspergillus tanneri]KAA8649517.1 Nonribosomal peptide synthetases (NRPS) [Aspergillus tanneri]
MQAYTAPLEDRIPPPTENERQLQRLIAEVLQLPLGRVGMQDNFFQLGGDSILAMTLVVITRKAGYYITMADIFNHSQLHDLAATAASTSENDPEDPGVLPYSLLNGVDSTDSLIKQTSEACNVHETSIEDIYPCTALQEGLMALSTKLSGQYIEQIRYELHSNIDLGRFISAWDATARANPILRIRIVQIQNNTMYQIVVRDIPLWHHFDDVNMFKVHVATANNMGLGDALVDLSIIKSSEDSQSYQFFLHHAVYDGWSLQLLWKHVQVAYDQKPVSSTPFSRYIRHTMDNAVGAEEFWASQFANIHAPVFPSLPSTRYVPTPTSVFEREISTRFQPHSSEHTLSAMIQLAWSIILSSYTDSDDVLFGLTVHGRNAAVPGIDNTTGTTIATVPFRVQLSSQSTVQDSVLELRRHMTAMIPFEHFGLQRIGALGSDAAAACNFQCHIGIQPPSSGSIISPRLVKSGISCHDSYSAFANYSLVLVFHLNDKDKGNVVVNVIHDAKVISSAATKRMIYQFEHILNQAIGSPETTLDRLDIVSPQDMMQLSEWHQALPQAHEDSGLYELVLSHAVQHPHASAIYAWDGVVSYLELDDLSLRLAKRLQGLGVRRGSMIPLCLDRSKWVIICMIAVLRAGGACVMLDPSHPTERTEDILRRTEAELVLTSSVHQDRFANIR